MLITIIDGKMHSYEQEFPMETYMGAVVWGMDMLRAIHKHRKFRKWLIKLAIGRHAFREMVGLDDVINEYGYDTHSDYGLEDMDYHREKVSL